jgi:hypothetical protein
LNIGDVDKPGKPGGVVVTVTINVKTEVELKGGTGRINMAMARQIQAALLEDGVTELRWERIR